MLQVLLPLRLWRDHLALPNVIAEHQQDVVGAEASGQVDEFFGALDVVLAHRVVEVDQAGGDHDDRDDRQVVVAASFLDQRGLIRGDGAGLGENIDRVEADSGDVFEAGLGVDAGLVEDAVDDSLQ